MTASTSSVRPGGSLRRWAGAVGVASLLLLGACGQEPGEVRADGAAEETAPAGAQDGAQDSGQEGAMEEKQMGDVSVAIPADWVESPEEEMDGDWTVGFDDAAEDPAIRIRMAPMINDSPHPDIAEAELVSRAMVGGYYGTEWEGVHRGKADITGSFRGFVTDFTYVSSDGDDMVGRWWLMTDPNTYEVAALEIAGQEDVLTDELLEQISDSVALKPQG